MAKVQAIAKTQALELERVMGISSEELEDWAEEHMGIRLEDMTRTPCPPLSTILDTILDNWDGWSSERKALVIKEIDLFVDAYQDLKAALG